MKSLKKFILNIRRKPSFWVVIIIVIIAVGGFLIYKYAGISIPFLPNSSIQTSTTDELKQLTSRISKLILLPEDEQPTLATVADKDKLTGQQFFQFTENGDKVLIYQKARKAYLYRPSENRIIEVGPVNIAPQSPASPSANLTENTETYKFILLNGTNEVGLTKKYEPELIKNIPQAEVLDRDNTKGNFDKSLIIDLKGDKKELTQNIALKLNLTVSELPKTEDKPTEGDFLIILGSDQIENDSPASSQ